VQWPPLPIRRFSVIFSMNHRLKYFFAIGPGSLSVPVTKQLRERLAVTMKSQGEIEAAVCEGMSRFEQEFMGRGPKDIHTHLIGNLLLIRLQGVLTAAEQHLVKTLPPEKGRDLLKQVRTHLVETSRPLLEAMIQEVTGARVVSLHHDISTVTGEEVVLFTLAEVPQFREARK
jgi:uncharacterized protein YbcI